MIKFIINGISLLLKIFNNKLLSTCVYMSVNLSNYSMATSGVNLANSSDVVANSYSVIQGDRIVNILDLIGTGGGGGGGAATIDAYTKMQSDVIIANIQLTPGPTGARGNKGDTGLTGPRGEKGNTGDTGIQGRHRNNRLTGQQRRHRINRHTGKQRRHRIGWKSWIERRFWNTRIKRRGWS